ncbi:MAG: trigger factor [Pirellulales bacterium]|nr:trigger factor [Pirellulales bacterium]
MARSDEDNDDRENDLEDLADSAQSEDGAESENAEPEKLSLDVKIDARGACQRHITVTVSREDVDRYLDRAFGELRQTALVPGFRAGRAPRRLVEQRFRKDVADQVKGSLLMDSLGQVTEEHNLAAISEPDFDPLVIEIPEEGPMTFEFDLEVRPEFTVPNWKGLKIERPVREISDADIDRRMQEVLTSRARLVPKDGAAAVGDYIATRLTFKHGDEVLSSSDEEVIRIRPVLSFRDGRIEKFDKLMKGVQAGETRTAEMPIAQDAPNEKLRGEKVTAVFDVLEVKSLELPEITPALLDTFDCSTEEEFRGRIGQDLQRQIEYAQQQRAREQVLAALTVAADWELPPELLKRQTEREMQRMVLELRRNGFTDREIQAHQNELRQNSLQRTAKMLKEHFILERIAEEEQVEDVPGDYDREIEMIASQSGESPRRTRAQLEKRGMMDILRNQIIERKVIEMILQEAAFKDVPFELPTADSEALDQSAGGGDEEVIPEAQESGIAEPLRTRPERE